MLQLIELSGALRSETQRESIVLAKPGRAYLCEATFSQPRPKVLWLSLSLCAARVAN